MSQTYESEIDKFLFKTKYNQLKSKGCELLSFNKLFKVNNYENVYKLITSRLKNIEINSKEKVVLKKNIEYKIELTRKHFDAFNKIYFTYKNPNLLNEKLPYVINCLPYDINMKIYSYIFGVEGYLISEDGANSDLNLIKFNSDIEKNNDLDDNYILKSLDISLIESIDKTLQNSYTKLITKSIPIISVAYNRVFLKLKSNIDLEIELYLTGVLFHNNIRKKLTNSYFFYKSNINSISSIIIKKGLILPTTFSI